MTYLIQSGGIKTTSNTTWRVGSATSLSSTRTILADGTGSNFVVTAGKTFYISCVYVAGGANSRTITIMYDDDGVGTNETTVFALQAAASQMTFLDTTYIAIPAQKYLTAKVGGDNTQGIYVFGAEL